jgi:hypothetical protein
MENEDREYKMLRHEELCIELNDIYERKNQAYGDSFGKTHRELGIISSVTRLYDKMNRVVALSTGTTNRVNDESIRDTLKDLANYAIMTIIELELEELSYVRAAANESYSAAHTEEASE